MSNPDLSLRARPQQARSQATVDRVLQAGADLLQEVGVDGFNTNLLAARAGVGTRAIYRYFPNKWAVLVAMAERAGDLERVWIGDLRDLTHAVDWREGLAATVDAYYDAARRHPGYAALRAASQASPELREVDERNSRALQADLALGLQTWGVEVDPRRLRILCLVILESAGRLLDLALQADPEDAGLLVEALKRMLTNLLADYMPDAATPLPKADRL